MILARLRDRPVRLAKITTLSGPVTTFVIPGSTYLYVDGINNLGQVVGYYANATGTHGFFRSSTGTISTLDVPGSANLTVANGLNDQGQIVGYYRDSSMVLHGFLLNQEGSYITLDHLPGGFPVTDTSLYGINDAGTIVGSYGSANTQHAFIATIPEPSSRILVILGVLSAVISRWRRKVLD